ncbi:MAG TPA: DUF4355 domain-containing protein [Candidatus Jeotgalibaca merdavium]|uniref:DUF4355 domain-containing protein n=1 Tax=Candidatus Jeotgalibaca merdavium TaxID=2838627 RepID=A0A9D2I066_9LACT|nr:DUF4355 domain-containing protein [Candidatus Jeotgalibaca merdavium]
MSFKPIETQEALDLIIKDRLAREREKYADYDDLKAKNASYETQVTALQKTIDESSATNTAHDDAVAELNAKIKGFETANLRTKIALQQGIPFDLVDRLAGDDEASIKADAERLAAFVKPKAPTPPLKTTEPTLGDDKDGPYKELLKNMNLKGE